MKILDYVTAPFKGITSFIKLLTANKYIASTARTVAAFVGGYLTQAGVDPSTVNEATTATEKVLIGLGTIAITQIFSWLDKARNQK